MHMYRTLAKDNYCGVQMGCFLGCFGFEKKKKRVNSRNRRSSGEKNHVSYVPLDTPKKNITSDSEFKEKQKESSRSKIKKKVRFNLNVKAYEPLKNEDDVSLYLSEDGESNKWEFDTKKRSMDMFKYEEDSILSSIQSVPQNYRYQNCRDGCNDEDEELGFEENDLEFDDVEDTDEDEDVFGSESDEEMAKESGLEVVNDDKTEERISSFEQILDLKDRDLEEFRPSCKTRDRSQYVLSVLNPVENLSQWKAVKGKAAPKKRQKENVALENQERKKFSNTKSDSEILAFRNLKYSNGCQTKEYSIAVDASLSNWLG